MLACTACIQPGPSDTDVDDPLGPVLLPVDIEPGPSLEMIGWDELLLVDPGLLLTLELLPPGLLEFVLSLLPGPLVLVLLLLPVVPPGTGPSAAVVVSVL